MPMNHVGKDRFTGLNPGDRIELQVTVFQIDAAGTRTLALNCPVHFECRQDRFIELGDGSRTHEVNETLSDGIATAEVTILPEARGRAFQIRAHIGPGQEECWFSLVVNQ